MGDEGLRGRGEFGITAVVGGEPLQKLLKVWVLVKFPGGRGEGTPRTHRRQVPQERNQTRVQNLAPNLRRIALQESGRGEVVEALGVTEQPGGVRPRPEKLVLVELVTVGPPVAAGGGEGLQLEVIFPFLAKVGKKSVENLGHGEKGGTEIPAKAGGFSFRDLSAHRLVLFEQDHLGVTLAAQRSLATGLAFLAWYTFAPQCVATLGVVRRETNSLKWTWAMIVYMFALAYLAAFVTYRVAVALGGG